MYTSEESQMQTNNKMLVLENVMFISNHDLLTYMDNFELFNQKITYFLEGRQLKITLAKNWAN